MLMPVPQTLAKKLNKDVFQRGREESGVHTERAMGTASQTLSRPEKRQGQASVDEGRESGEKKRSSIKSDKSKSASSTAATGMRAERSRQRRG